MRDTITNGGLARIRERRVPVGFAHVGHLTLGILALIVASGTFAAELGTVLTALQEVYLVSSTFVVLGWILAWLAVWVALEIVWMTAQRPRQHS